MSYYTHRITVTRIWHLLRSQHLQEHMVSAAFQLNAFRAC